MLLCISQLAVKLLLHFRRLPPAQNVRAKQQHRGQKCDSEDQAVAWLGRTRPVALVPIKFPLTRLAVNHDANAIWLSGIARLWYKSSGE